MSSGFDSKSVFLLCLVLFLLGNGITIVPSEARAQAEGTADSFLKLGVGFSDYTGDFPAEVRSHPFDFQEFQRGNGIPFLFTGELGYQHTPKWALVFGFQSGNYPIVGFSGSTIEDSQRYTPQLLARYTFGDPDRRISPYIDGGLNVTFGGGRPTSPGVGPSIGGGVSVRVSPSTLFYVESRFNFTVPDDAIDGASSDRLRDPAPFDMANQLLGVGVRTSIDLFEGEDTEDETPSPSALAYVPDTSDVDPRYDPDRYEDMTLVPDGTFMMGLTNEDPLSLQNAGRKRVTVSAFYIDQYEVTNSEYRAFLENLSGDERQARFPDSTAWREARSQESWSAYFRSDFFSNHPVVAVTLEDARAYCQAQGKRLPTEAEWEYAARAGRLGRVYPWEGLGTQSESGEYLANYNPSEGYAFDGYAFTAPVDTFPSNEWELYNMAGNVAEWTQDAYTPSYDNISDFNPLYEDEEEERRVVRGGAWNSGSFFIGVGMRDTQVHDEATATIGFRCVREVAGANQSGSSGPAPGTPNGNAGSN